MSGESSQKDKHMKITKEQLKEIIKKEITDINESRASDYDPKYGGSGTVSPEEEERETTPERGMTLREPWDGIEENAQMIGDNVIKIEYLARKLGIEIPVEPKL